MNSNITCEHCARDKWHCSRAVHGSHGTIHTLKNYFATVFSVSAKINYIQTDLKCSLILCFNLQKINIKVIYIYSGLLELIKQVKF